MLKTSNYGAIALSILLCCNLSGCSNAIQDLKNTSINSKRTTPISITGKVEFPTKFNTKANINDIITNSTVSLVYPQDYQEENLRSKPIASGLSDNNGVFTINPAPTFDPVVGQIFILEATKRINSTGGAAITLRTLVQWNGQFFKSITKNSIYLNSKTTALAIMSNFNTIKPEDTIEKMELDNGQIQVPDIIIQNTSTPDPNDTYTITSAMINYVKGLVETSLNNDVDPVYNIYYQQKKFLLKDISLGTINKLRGCISTNGNCNGIVNSIPIVENLGTTISNTDYLFRKDDILVNTTTVGNQSDTSIAINKRGMGTNHTGMGDKVVTWVSNDGNGKGIYAQRYFASGAKNGNEFRVNDNIVGDQFVEYGCKSVAMSDDGSFMIIWTQPDINTLGVFAKKFNPDGSENGSAFQVNTELQNFQNFASISARGNGDYVVTWSSVGQDGDDAGVYARRFFSDGGSSSEFKVNTTTEGSQFVPDVAVNSDGYFVVTWASYEYIFNVDAAPTWKVYAQKFNDSGDTVGNQFRVDTQDGTSDNYNPQVAIDSNKNFVITWHYIGNEGHDVKAAKFDFTTVSPAEFNVNTVRGGEQGNSKISMNDRGEFVITWLDLSGNDGSGYGIHARKYNIDSSNNVIPKEDEFIVNKYRRKTQILSAVAIDNNVDNNAPSSRYSIAWSSYGQDNSEYGIFMQNFNFKDTNNYSPITGNPVQAEGCVGEGGVCLTGEQQVNFTSLGNQENMSIATVKSNNSQNGNHVVVWTSESQIYPGAKDIYAQIYNSFGQKMGSEIKVSETEPWINNHTSVISKNVGIDNNGNFIVTWSAYGTEGNGWEVYAQRFNSSGKKIGAQFRVNDSILAEQLYPSVSVNSSGQFIITWGSNQSGSWDIYAKKYSNIGVGESEFKVNTISSSFDNNPDVFLADNGKYIITWTNLQANWNIYAKMYDSNNSVIVNELALGNIQNNQDNWDSDAVIDSNGRAIITWHRGINNSGNNIKANILEPTLNPNEPNLGTEFTVTSNTAGEQGSPSIALLNNNNFVITWHNLSNVTGDGYKVYARRFNSNLSPIDANDFEVNTFTGNNQYTNFEVTKAQPKISSDINGNFNIVWQSEGQDGSGKSVHIKRFYSNGNAR